ncbi:STM4015 family protein [Streptomyces sp. NPDC014733]|uniref:STM4015 family protein n=1 Tax=Streptomyces sp. NPDC014733 TaxID=3364885 RepID=UPI0036F5CEDF
MTISRHLEHFHGLPVHDFGEPGEGPELPDAAAVAWRLAVEEWDAEESWPQLFARFAATVDLPRVRALIVGTWGESFENGPGPVREALLAERERLSGLRALFLGDITFEECEISWIVQEDATPLLTAFPALEEFGVRGGTSLEFPAVAHPALRRLTIETGGVDVAVVRGVAACDLPALERLDLWLGSSWYGANTTVDDLAPFLDGTRWPRLTHLALHNSEIQDDIAAALATAPVVARLHTLDLSMGTLSDAGAAALLAGQPLTHLTRLDLHHHYLTEAMQERVRTALTPAGVEVDLGEPETADGDGDRYVAVAE